MSRYCWVEVLPFASTSDAESRLPDLETSIVRDPRTKVVGAGGRRVESAEIPEAAEFPFVYETPIVGRNGPSVPKMIGGSIGHIVFVVSCSEMGPGWSWSEVAEVARAQADKVRSVLDGTK
jgi:hypothetical protein